MAATPAQPAPATPAPRPSAQLLARASAVIDAALQEKDPEGRGEALNALGLSQRTDAREKLVVGLKDEAGPVRFGAAQGLRWLRDPSLGGVVMDAWRREKGWAVRKELAEAAGACGVAALAPELKQALRDPNQGLREAAAWALVDLGDPEGTRALTEMGNPERKTVRKENADRWSRRVLRSEKQGDPALAARALGEMGTLDDVPLLAPYLESAAKPVRLWAAAAILRLGR
jgi:HEAT repeat protein